MIVSFVVKLLKPITNQRLRLLAVTLMIGTILLDIGVAEIRYLVPDSVRPSDSNFVINPAPNGAMLERLSEQTGQPCDVIFIGASNVEYFNTEGSDAWNRFYAPRHAFNFGVRGDKTENVLWRFDHTLLNGLKPKVAVIFIGLNNLNSTPRETALGVEAITKKTKAIFPGIKVLITSLTPNGRDNAQVVKVNQLLKAYADNKTVFYVDIYSHMPRQGGNWKGLRPDRLHLTPEGYEMWAEQMEPYMQKFLPPLPVTPAATTPVPPVATR